VGIDKHKKIWLNGEVNRNLPHALAGGFFFPEYLFAHTLYVPMALGRRLLVGAVSMGFFLFLPYFARAETLLPTIIVSEIGWAGSSKSEVDEWIELTNVSDDGVSLAGWKIEGILSGMEILSLPNNILPPHSTFLIANYFNGNAKSVLTHVPDLVTTAVSLSNSSLHILVKRPEGTVADEVGDGHAPAAGHAASPGIASMVRVASIGNGVEKDRWTMATKADGFIAGTIDLGTPGILEPWFMPMVPPPPVPPFLQPSPSMTHGEDSASSDSQPQPPFPVPPLLLQPPPPPIQETIISSETSAVKIPEPATIPTPTPDPPPVLTVPVAETIPQPIIVPIPSMVPALVPDRALPVPVQTKETNIDVPIPPAPAPIDTITTIISAPVTAAVLNPVIPPPIIFPPGTLRLNEFVSMPSGEEKEWIEIVNPFNNVIPLSGWNIRDAGKKITPLPNQLLGFGHYVLVRDPKGMLNDEGDRIELISPDGTVQDSVVYGSGGMPKPGRGQALAFVATGDWRITTQLTPGEMNVVVAPVPPVIFTDTRASEASATTVVEIARGDNAALFSFSELYPNTQGNDVTEEFIEIKNMSTAPADFLGWSLTDRSRRTYQQKTSLLLAPGESAAFFRPLTSITLNNDGDSIRLIRPDASVAEEQLYEKAPHGFAYARIDGTWTWTHTPTPDETNMSSLAVEKPVPMVPVPVMGQSAEKTAPAEKPKPVPPDPNRRQAKPISPPALKKQSGSPRHMQGILGTRAGRNVFVENEGKTFTIFLPAGIDAGAAGIRSGRRIEATGILTIRNHLPTLVVAKTSDIITSEAYTPTVAPAGAKTDVQNNNARTATRLAFASLAGIGGLALKRFFGTH